VQDAIDTITSEEHPFIREIEIHYSPGNLGVAGSFNYILTKLGPCIIACNDTHFCPGVLKTCLEFIARNHSSAYHYLNASTVFHVPQLFLDRIGYFDENLWPWGWDDIDVSFRMKKLRLPVAIFPKEMGTIVHDHPTQSMRAATESLRRWMLKMAARNRRYGMKKWSIRNEHLGMLDPKDDWAIDPAVLGNPVRGWILDQRVREERIQMLKNEVGIETPLIFCRERNVLPSLLRQRWP
jgi:hypothetical protein